MLYKLVAPAGLSTSAVAVDIVTFDGLGTTPPAGFTGWQRDLGRQCLWSEEPSCLRQCKSHALQTCSLLTV